MFQVPNFRTDTSDVAAPNELESVLEMNAISPYPLLFENWNPPNTP